MPNDDFILFLIGDDEVCPESGLSSCDDCDILCDFNPNFEDDEEDESEV